MNKFFFILLIGFLFLPLLSAQENGGVVFDIEKLIDKGLFNNEAEIRLKAQFLTHEERLMLEENNKKGALGYFAANYFLGFGIGSFRQQDTVGGWIAFGGEMTGHLLILPLYITIIDFYLSLLSLGSGSESFGEIAQKGERMETYMNLAYAGMGMIIAGRIFGLVRPWFYSSVWNTALHSVLQESPLPPISFMPVVLPGGIGLAVSMEL